MSESICETALNEKGLFQIQMEEDGDTMILKVTSDSPNGETIGEIEAAGSGAIS